MLSSPVNLASPFGSSTCCSRGGRPCESPRSREPQSRRVLLFLRLQANFLRLLSPLFSFFYPLFGFFFLACAPFSRTPFGQDWWREGLSALADGGCERFDSIMVLSERSESDAVMT